MLVQVTSFEPETSVDIVTIVNTEPSACTVTGVEGEIYKVGVA